MLILRRVPRRSGRTSVALAAAETTTALGIAHTAAGGELPSAGWLLAIAATAYAAGALVLRRQAPMRLVLPALVALQVMLHAWLVTLTAHQGGHAAVAQEGPLGLSWPMLLAHVVAGAVAAVAWALRRRAVDVLLAWTHAAPLAVPPAPRSTGDRSPAPLVPAVLAGGASTRGPPAVLAVTA